MPLRYVLDENLRGILWRAIQRHNAATEFPIDAVRVGDPQDLPRSVSDPELLLWAEREQRIIVTFDAHTMPEHLEHHLSAGRHSPGVFMLLGWIQLRSVVEYLSLAAYASDADEWRDRIEYLRP